MEVMVSLEKAMRMAMRIGNSLNNNNNKKNAIRKG